MFVTHEAIFKNWEKNYFCNFFVPPERQVHTNPPPLFWKRADQAPAGRHSATFPSEQAGKGTDSMPHIHRLFSGEGETKHISMGEYNPYLQSSPFPLASPTSSNYHQAATHQECHLGEREQVITNIPTMFENLSILLMQFFFIYITWFS